MRTLKLILAAAILALGFSACATAPGAPDACCSKEAAAPGAMKDCCKSMKADPQAKKCACCAKDGAEGHQH